MGYSKKEIYRLWDTYYPRVYGYFYNRVSNRQDVEDLTSITMAIFLDKMENSDIVNPNAYLWRVAYNQLLVFIKSKSKFPVSIDIGEFEEFKDDSKIKHDKANLYKNIIKSARKILKNPDLQIILSIYEKDKNATEIANNIGMKPANVRLRHRRALAKLKIHPLIKNLI